MEYNNDPKLIESNQLLNARLIAQNELISELKQINEFLIRLIKSIRLVKSIVESKNI